MDPSPMRALWSHLPYLTFVGLMARARLVLTDSGGIQEETTMLGIPCLTLRWNTERPVTIERGTNRLVGTNPKEIKRSVGTYSCKKWCRGERPPLWDGGAGRRIADVIEALNVTLRHTKLHMEFMISKAHFPSHLSRAFFVKQGDEMTDLISRVKTITHSEINQT